MQSSAREDLIYKQARSQKFIRGQTRGMGTDRSPHRDPGAEYGNPREHQRGGDKNWPTVTGGGEAPMSPLRLRPCIQAQPVVTPLTHSFHIQPIHLNHAT